MSARDRYEARQRAERLAAALRAILHEANKLDGLADTGDQFITPAVLEGAARDLRSSVASLVDELHDDLEPAASGISRASPEEQIALLDDIDW